jgi:hypothetical protein
MCDVSLYTLPRAQIDLGDHRYWIEALPDPGQLKALATPPLVRKIKDCYVVVAGFERARMLAKTREQCRCLVLSCDSEARYSEVAVAERVSQGTLGPAGLIRAVGLLNRFMDVDHMARQSETLFNTRLSSQYLRELVDLGQLAHPGLELLEKGQVSIKSLKRISCMDPDLAAEILTLFSRIKVSVSKQNDILTWMFEIAARERTNALAICREPGVQEILFHKNPDPVFRGNLLRTWLQTRRFPALEARKKRVTTALNRLNLGRGLRMTLPEHFESDIYTVAMAFKTREQFVCQLQALGRVADHPAFEKILER